MKKYTTTIILVGLFVGLLAFFYLYEVKKEDKSETDDTLAAKTFNVLDVNSDDVKLINIKHDEVEIEINKQEDNTWKITKPKEANADLDKINSILDEYKVIEGKEEKIDASDLKEFGLDKPKGIVKFQFNDDSEKEINFGDNSIDETNIYTKITDQDYVFLTDKFLFDKINVKVEDLKEVKEETPSAVENTDGKVE